jgi:hypothetical protein
MADVLIRDIPDAVLTAIDAHASKLGLSRSEYLRRQLSQDARRSDSGVTADDLRGFARMFKDLNDPEVMAGAWS